MVEILKPTASVKPPLRPQPNTSPRLQDAALVHLFKQFHILSTVNVNADEHGTRNVERFSQGSSDLVWMINSEARGAECLRVLDRSTGPTIETWEGWNAFISMHSTQQRCDC
jgi:hypothetical protein